MDAASIINRAVQLNPNNWRFWKARGFSGRPEEWLEMLQIVEGKWMVLLKYSQCAHGIIKNSCTLCSGLFIYGAVISITVSTIAVLYYFYPKECKEYAMKGVNATGSLCRFAANYVDKNARVLGPHVWYYGAVMPYSAAKYGVENVTYYSKGIPSIVSKQGENVVYYSGVTYAGLKILASKIGYFCGVPQSQKYSDKDE